MEKNPYLSIMIQSLKKKSAVLDADRTAGAS